MNRAKKFFHKGIILSVLGLFAAPAIAVVDLEHGQALYQKNCASCHGADGNSVILLFPNLSKQHEVYLKKELHDYQQGAQGKRNDPIMTPVAQRLSQQDVEDIVSYIASFPGHNDAVQPNLLVRGQQLYRAGDHATKVPACASCHAPTGEGNAQAVYPALAGQHADYIVQQLKAFQSGQRSNDPHAVMQTIATRLSDADMQAVASFISGLHS